MTIRYAKTPQDALKAIYDAKEAAEDGLKRARKAMADAAGWRWKYFSDPASLHNDMLILEQQIGTQIDSLQTLIILYGRLVADIQDEAQKK